MLHRLAGVKNTNKKDGYLEKKVDLVTIGADLMNSDKPLLQAINQINIDKYIKIP